MILLVTPLLLILVLGLSLGEGFGEKPDERLRISIVNLDAGLKSRQAFPEKPWSEVVIDDLSATQDIRLEIIADRAEAEKLVARGSRPAVLIFEPDFSDRMNRCSFLSKDNPPPINPLGRDGVRMADLGLTMLVDKTQPVSAAVIDQVTQVTLLRVVIPWMIGRAFERVGDDAFMAAVAERLNAVKPVPPEVLEELDPVVQKLLAALTTDPEFAAIVLNEFRKAKGSDFIKATQDAAIIAKRTPEFQRAVHTAFTRKELMGRVGQKIAFGEVLTPAVRKQVGPEVQDQVGELFSNYNFHAKTWADLVKSDARQGNEANRSTYHNTSGTGFLNRGAVRYQMLVPSYTVMFAFFLVLSVGWLFVAERKHGTLVAAARRAADARTNPVGQAPAMPRGVADAGVLPAAGGPGDFRHDVGVAAGLADRGHGLHVVGGGGVGGIGREHRADRDAGRGLWHAARAGPRRRERLAHAARPHAREDEDGQPRDPACLGTRCVFATPGIADARRDVNCESLRRADRLRRGLHGAGLVADGFGMTSR